MGENDLGQRFCICLKSPRYVGQPGATAGVAGVYEPICGECRDPCSLRFIPDTYPRKKTDKKDEGNKDADAENAKVVATSAKKS